MPTLELFHPRYYGPVFQWTLLALVLWVISACYSGRVYLPATRHSLGAATGVFVAFWGILVGLRPVHYMFGDTVIYAVGFKHAFAEGQYNWVEKLFSFEGEYIFGAIQDFCLEYGNLQLLFFIFAALYFGCQYLATRRLFGAYWFAPYLAMACMIDYFGFAVNGMRNGAASALMILALTYHKRLRVAIPLTILACGIHKSMLLLACAAILAHCFTRTNVYLACWVACIGLAAVAGNTISAVLSSSVFSAADGRMAHYIDMSQQEWFTSQFSRIGFRPDFLLYSAVPIIVGYWFLNMRKQDDVHYRWWLNTYIIANSFWVLNMYSSVSNRFAVISWFIAGIVLLYPLFKFSFIRHQGRIAAGAFACWFSFDLYQCFIR